MKKFLFLLFSFFFFLPTWAMDAAMYQWKSHFAYGSVTQVIETPTVVYGLAGGAVFSINKSSEEVQTYSKQSGLNGGDIAQIAYDALSKTLIIAYTDGLIDFMKDGVFTPMIDLQQKTLSSSKQTNKIIIRDGIAYFCMPFGIMAVDVNNHLIKDTYYIGDNGSDVNVLDLSFGSDSVYAISSSTFYTAANGANWMDYRNWYHTAPLPADSTYHAVAVVDDQVFVLANQKLLQRKSTNWVLLHSDMTFRSMHKQDKTYLCTDKEGIYYINPNTFVIEYVASPYVPQDLSSSNKNTYWLATANDGIVRQTGTGTQSFAVNGPAVNIPYRLKIVNDRLYMLAGQRWADENPIREPNIMIYDIQKNYWNNIYSAQVGAQTGALVFDLMNVAVDPFDPEHFYITTYGTGLLECKGLDVVNHFTLTNSPIESAAPTGMAYKYVRTDGALFDAQGNLWLLNAGVDNVVHVATPQQLASSSASGQGDWYKMPIQFVGTSVGVHTPGEMFIDSRHANWKWIPIVRATTGLILLDDNGTPQYKNDDEAVYRNSFVDQDGKTVNPTYIYTTIQDKDGTLWLALENGLITIPSDVDFKTSNRCERIKIARNDGTGLADYLLETEVINAIAIDGANRKWFGTKSSGIYLISEDGQTTIDHFTEDNSPLLSNEILSLVVDPHTGRVFIGTSKGLMSYQSDAAMPFDDYSSVYAYPNPVRPNYEGVITITGLKDGSTVHITDAAGNLVCETYSLGGTAIWDGRTADGRRAASGVYTVFLNETTDGSHAVTKILLMH